MTEEAPRIRPARPADVGAVLALLAAARLPAAGVPEAVGAFSVAEAGGEVVGAAGCEPHGPCVLLRSVAVLPLWRAHGLGTGLVEAVLTAARARGARAAYLLTETAEGFFTRRGFRRVPRETAPAEIRGSAAFASARCAGAACMRREL